MAVCRADDDGGAGAGLARLSAACRFNVKAVQLGIAGLIGLEPRDSLVVPHARLVILTELVMSKCKKEPIEAVSATAQIHRPSKRVHRFVPIARAEEGDAERVPVHALAWNDLDCSLRVLDCELRFAQVTLRARCQEPGKVV